MRTAVVSILLAVAAGQGFAQSPPAIGVVLAAPGGRYVFGQISDWRRDQYLLDTQSGRLWKPLCLQVNKDDSKSCDILVMSPMPFIDNLGNSAGLAPPVK